jgi:hypothetical protein
MKVYFLDRILVAIQRQGGGIKEELNYRAWERLEHEAILHFVRNGMGNWLAQVLVARNEHAIGDQICHLQTIGLLSTRRSFSLITPI